MEPTNRRQPTPAERLGDSRTHGTRSTYRKGCSCEYCCEAERSYRQDYRRRLFAAFLAGQPTSRTTRSEAEGRQA